MLERGRPDLILLKARATIQLTYMRTVCQNEAIGDLRSFSCKSETDNTTPIMGDYDRTEVLSATGSFVVLFSCGNNELSHSPSTLVSDFLNVLLPG